MTQTHLKETIQCHRGKNETVEADTNYALRKYNSGELNW